MDIVFFIIAQPQNDGEHNGKKVSEYNFYAYVYGKKYIWMKKQNNVKNIMYRRI